MVTKTAALLQKQATPEELASDLARPSVSVAVSDTGKSRKALDELPVSDLLTPATAIRAMRCAKTLSDVPYFVSVAMEALRRDPNLLSVLQTRVLAVSSLPIIAEAGGKKLQDRKAAERIQEIVSSEEVESVIPSLLLHGAYLGFGVAQNFITATPTSWELDGIEEVDARFITFDTRDMKTPLLLPQELGGKSTPLLEKIGKYIYHRPGILGGNPATSGIAYTALFFYALKAVVLNGWTSFAELFGQPVRIGKFPDGLAETPEGKKNLDVLKRALRDMGGDAWAMLPESMQIEIVEAASRKGSAEVYERLCRYLDELLAKLVLGGSLTSGTGNTGSGGSQALGAVHNEVREDIKLADAKSLALTLRRYLAKPFTAVQFAGAATPKLYLLIEKPKDIQVRVNAACSLIDRGFKVPASEMYALLEIRAPEEGEEVLSGRAVAQPQDMNQATSQA